MENKMRNESNEKIIAVAKERLKWYTEASIEEFDENEVDAFVKLLNTLEPPKVRTEQENEADLERFRAYCNMRMNEGGFMDEETIEKVTAKVEKMASDTVEDSKMSVENGESIVEPKANKRKTLFTFIRAHKFATAVAVIFFFVLIVGGSFGAVNAEKNAGFFFWLSKDDEGVTMITSPEDMSANTGVVTDTKYGSIDQVPEQYLKYIVEKDELTTLESYDFQSVNIGQSDSFCMVQQAFSANQGEKSIMLGVKIYINEATLMRENYLSEESQVLEEKEWEGELLVQENIKNSKEYTVLFYVGNRQYYVEGNCDKEELDEIAEEYSNFVMMFNND